MKEYSLVYSVLKDSLRSYFRGRESRENIKKELYYIDQLYRTL